MHPDESLIALKLSQLSQLTTDVLVQSLRPGSRDSLKARADGTMLDGHHRIYIPRSRGIDVNALPREIGEGGFVFMKPVPSLYWLEGPWPGRLAVGPRPRGGDWLEDEITAWSDAGIQHVVSLLTTEEIRDLEIGDEARLSAAHSLQYLSLPIPDREPPPSDATAIDLIRRVTEELDKGENVLIHCRQGIGRSGLIAAAVLAAGGVSVDEAFARISKARRVPVPETIPQQRWVERVAPLLVAAPVKPPY